MQKLSEILFSSLKQENHKIIFLFFPGFDEKAKDYYWTECFKPLIGTFSSLLFSQFQILETLHQQWLFSILLWITRLELKLFVLKIYSHSETFLNLFTLFQTSLQRIIWYQTKVLIESHSLKDNVFDCNCRLQSHYWLASE